MPSDAELVSETQWAEGKLQMRELVELALLEWRALVLIGRYIDAEHCIRNIVRS